MRSPVSPWIGSIIAAIVALVLVTLWSDIPGGIFFVAAAAYFALSPEHRTRASASLVGWSVGFVLAVLGSFWRTTH
jgi:hypothetical protein